MKFAPYPYQRRAIDWITGHERCALFLDMGLGKSVITLTALRELAAMGENVTALVVAPKKVAESTWSAEVSKWDHLRDLRVSVVLGDVRARVRALETPADVYVTGRDNFAWLVGYYNGRMPFDVLVLDELTSFKSPKSQRFKACRKVTPQFARVIGLTGTPAPNGLEDLWAQMFCIDMGARLGKSVTRYREKYFNRHIWNNICIKCTPKKGAEKEIRGLIGDICLTMQAADYLTLPAMMVHDVHVTLPPAVQRQYDELEREQILSLEPGAELLAGSAAALMNKLSQMANGCVYDSAGEVHGFHTEKAARLAEIVEEAQSPVLVFYQYRHDVPLITGALKGSRVRVYKDAADLNDWNAGGIDVLLAHPASTAYGLNMQAGGHYIVWFGTGWDLELYQQANARLHRQGQQHPVTVYRLITAGTVDERAAAALDRKQTGQQALLAGLKQLLAKYGNNC